MRKLCGESGTGHGDVAQAELLKLQKSSQFPDEPVVYYESIKRELNKRLIFDSRCDARLKAKAEGCTRLAYTMWREEP